MRALIGFLLVLVVASACGAGEPERPLNTVQFRDAFIAEVRRTDPTLEVKVLSDDEVQVSRGEQKANIYLGNLYADYLQEPERLPDLLQRMTTLAVRTTSGSEPAVDKAKLVTMLRPTSYLEIHFNNAADQGSKAVRLANRPFAGDLLMVIGQDEGDSFWFPPLDELGAAFDGDLDAAWATALEATRRRSLAPTVMAAPPGAIMLEGDEGMAGGLILQDEIWRRPEIARLGGRLAVTPGKDVLMVASADDAEAVARLKVLVAEFPNDMLIPRLLVREGGTWKVMDE